MSLIPKYLLSLFDLMLKRTLLTVTIKNALPFFQREILLFIAHKNSHFIILALVMKLTQDLRIVKITSSWNIYHLLIIWGLAAILKPTQWSSQFWNEKIPVKLAMAPINILLCKWQMIFPISNSWAFCSSMNDSEWRVYRWLNISSRTSSESFQLRRGELRHGKFIELDTRNNWRLYRLFHI